MSHIEQDQPQKRPNIAIIGLLIITGLCICAICISVSYFIWGNQFKDWQTSKNQNLRFQQSATDGSVFGIYHTPNQFDVHFAVTKDGFATFSLDGVSESETLQVGLQEDRTVRMNWRGITVDGFGELTVDEQNLLDDLYKSNLADALAMIPLDIACQEEDHIDPQQIAALLVPLQMQFKYLISDRIEETNRLISLSECNYGNPTDSAKTASLIQFSPSQPVPVVFGYFPFDGDGAIEAPEFSSSGSKSACLNPVEIGSFVALSSPKQVLASAVGDIYNETGPCNARCRGACGPDCVLSNCKHTEERRCEKDEMGRNTGMVVVADVYDCGLHEGCIEHDLCYDACNAFLGCETWLAALCRHGWNVPSISGEQSMCDETAIINYGPVDPVLWARGYGPQPQRKTFIYPNEDFEKTQNLVMCPVDEGEKEEIEKEPSEVGPEDSKVDGSTEKQPTEKEVQPMGPCDLMPPGERSSRAEDNQCIHHYSDQPGERLIQIWQSPSGSLDHEKACQSIVDSEFHIVMKEVDYGVCGYQVQPAVEGTPGVLGYIGWSVIYIFDGYSIRVHTNDSYPANQTWIYAMAEEIEQNIHKTLEGGGD